MKLWKILVVIPYVLILGWMTLSYVILLSGNLGGIFVGAAFMYLGLIMLLGYSAILVVVLLIRWIIAGRKK